MINPVRLLPGGTVDCGLTLRELRYYGHPFSGDQKCSPIEEGLLNKIPLIWTPRITDPRLSPGGAHYGNLTITDTLSVRTKVVAPSKKDY